MSRRRSESAGTSGKSAPGGRGAAQSSGRLPYHRPVILSREKLEVIAAVCSPGKALGQPGECVITQNS